MIKKIMEKLKGSCCSKQLGATITSSTDDEKYWNDKWPKAPIIYGGRVIRGQNDRFGVDVKRFVNTNDEILENIIKRYKLKKATHNDTALAIQQWVVKFLKYEYDEVAYQAPEFWLFPFETLKTGIGDCEDGAILISSLCIQAGIPAYRIKVSAGFVQSAPTAPQGGHAYCIYLADRPDLQEKRAWVILDWCYAEDSRVNITSKPLAKNGGQRNAYKDVWFTFNHEHSWAQTSLCINKKVANDRADLSSNTLAEITTNQIDIKSVLKDVDAKYKRK